MTSSGGGLDFSLLGGRDDDWNCEERLDTVGGGKVSGGIMLDLSRLVSNTGSSGLLGAERVGIPSAALINLTQDEHPVLQNIMQMTAGLDFCVIHRPDSMGVLVRRHLESDQGDAA